MFGLDVAIETFRALDPEMTLERLVAEGEWRERGPVLALEGSARAILTAERTALNFLQRLSGVATMAARCVQAVAGTGATILDTRKTTPGLRALEKAAVAAGGATNHRAGLYDAILIKENHAALAGGVGEAVRQAHAHAPELQLEVECRTLAEVDEALAAGAGFLLLDNMSVERAPSRRRSRRGPGEARGERRGHARHAPGGREHRRRLHLSGCDHPQRPGARPVPPPRTDSMNLPMFGAADAPLLLENIPALQDEVRALAQRARRGDPRPQLPAARDPGRRRLRRRLARPLAAGGGRRRRDDRVLRRALHGRDGLDPVPRQDGADPRSRRRLLARGLDHRRAAARRGRRRIRARRRHVRQHHRRGQGGDRLLLHLGERGQGRAAHLRRARRRRPRSCSARTCSSAPTSRRRSDARCTCGTASATCTPGSSPTTSPRSGPPTPAPTS